MSVIVVAGPARRARRPQAGAPPDPLLHVRPGAAARPAAHQVRQGRRRGHGHRTTPTATRPSTRPWPAWSRTSRCATRSSTGTATSAAPAPTRARRPCATRSAGSAPLALELMAGIDEETVDFIANYDATSEEPTVLPARFPNLLVNGSPGHRRGHGHQHPAAQPGRGHRRHHPPARAPRGHARRPDGVRQGPGLPDRGARSWAARGSSTPTAPGAARSRCAPSPRSRRAATATPASWSPRCPTRPRSSRSRRRSHDLVKAGDLDGIAEAAERLGRAARPAWSSGSSATPTPTSC